MKSNGNDKDFAEMEIRSSNDHDVAANTDVNGQSENVNNRTIDRRGSVHVRFQDLSPPLSIIEDEFQDVNLGEVDSKSKDNASFDVNGTEIENEGKRKSNLKSVLGHTANSMKSALRTTVKSDKPPAKAKKSVHVSFPEVEEIPMDDMKKPSHPSSEVEVTPKVYGRHNIPKELLRKEGKKISFPNPLTYLSNKIASLFERDFRQLKSKNGRHIIIDPYNDSSQIDERIGKPFIKNSIVSSRYNKYNFVPLQIIAQFSKTANCYFLLIAIMQMIPGWSTTGTYTTIIPLLIFISIAILREGYDNFRRYRQDRVENRVQVQVLRHVDNAPPIIDEQPSFFRRRKWRKRRVSQDTGSRSNRSNSVQGIPDSPTLHSPTIVQSKDASTNLDPQKLTPFESIIKPTFFWANCDWKDVRIGDIVRLTSNESVPADVIALSSPYPNGAVYVETAALDGETSLKTKLVNSTLRSRCTDINGLSSLSGECIVEDPNGNLYEFNGRILLNSEEKEIPIANNDVIYRGSILRNTPELFGLVIYTGEETKIRMNASRNLRVKAPSMQRDTNKIVIFIFVLVLSMAIYCTVAYFIWQKKVETKLWYLSDGRLAVVPVLVSFIILYNTMVPISLYVSMEIIRVCQTFLVQSDIDMYYPDTNTRCEIRSSSILEELGQVTHVFSDKTGTLTDNIMLFRNLSVGGFAWQHIGAENPRLLPTTNKKDANDEIKTPQFSENIEGTTIQLLQYVNDNPHTTFSKKVRIFLLSMAICHTCLPSYDEKDDIYRYQSTSPDELALVHAAQQLGYIVIDRDMDAVTIRLHYLLDNRSHPITKTYKILNTIEFSSKRKRMSVIVRMPNGRICLFTKGADSTITERLRLSELAKRKSHTITKAEKARKSVEIDKAIIRNSMSTARPSLTASRPSLTRRRADYINNVTSWLDERRQRMGSIRPRASTSILDTRRRPAPGRHSFAVGERLSDKKPSKKEEAEGSTFEGLCHNDAAIFENTFKHVNAFASDGLRTLIYAHKYLEEEEYQEWKAINDEALSSLTNRQQLLDDAAELIENNLEFSGATAIEDKLQAGVPESINSLFRAGIKFWVLTGDKKETAINIGHSCGVIKGFSTVVVLGSVDEKPGSDDTIKGGQRLSLDHPQEIDTANLVIHQLVSSLKAIESNSVAHLVLVIDGATLDNIENDREVFTLFINTAVKVDSVICCRASPMQKAFMVKSVRENISSAVTLAIGDGANDIAMIQEAHVGIGIAGLEGLQAARSSDFSIGRFKFLIKLLFCHGRWSYVRLSKYILGTFYKEQFFFLMQAIMQPFVGYTGQSLYENWGLTCFNTLFSSLCVIGLGIFDKDLNVSTVIAVPELYQKGINNEAFNWRVYMSWSSLAFMQAFLVFYVTYALYGIKQLTDNNLFAFGQLIFTAAIAVMNFKLVFIEMQYVNVISYFVVFVTLLGWFFFNMFISDHYPDQNIYLGKSQFFHHFGKNAGWWLTVLLVTVLALVLDIILQMIRRMMKPTDTDIFVELESDAFIHSRFEQESKEFFNSNSNETDEIEQYLKARE
ncbi:trans-Golgi network aminophospholipid translocase (flippase), Dnf1 [Schizosaccharomyces osmophilus]|uniref:Phospholipid-transporting ATPase n=1 Tax=Schizosaccharomyces osmophilus TaxID=2545709 RepID=A0AAE9W984_9SCHI|nr:trans-Golgi network aminophospholipid translocase (flippase), Dnf1 [Schizosaccharomyces osmophilus]WBW72014.1 trans-Golgi network aminophospholipid translocase (flippase), Dnf1 [Schizosaccharomyces osmophilus]